MDKKMKEERAWERHRDNKGKRKYLGKREKKRKGGE